MELNVQLDASQINQTIQEAIAKSAIGEELNKVIGESVKRLSTSWDNPIKNIVNREIEEAIRKAVVTTYSEDIKKFVTEKMTQEFMQDTIDKLWESWKNSR